MDPVFNVAWLMEILPRGTASDKVLCDNAFNIAKCLKCDRYHRRLVLMVYKFFDKKTLDLTEELLKPIIGKFENPKVHLSFRYNIWVVYLADMQLISKFRKLFWFL